MPRRKTDSLDLTNQINIVTNRKNIQMIYVDIKTLILLSFDITVMFISIKYSIQYVRPSIFFCVILMMIVSSMLYILGFISSKLEIPDEYPVIVANEHGELGLNSFLEVESEEEKNILIKLLEKLDENIFDFKMLCYNVASYLLIISYTVFSFSIFLYFVL